MWFSFFKIQFFLLKYQFSSRCKWSWFSTASFPFLISLLWLFVRKNIAFRLLAPEFCTRNCPSQFVANQEIYPTILPTREWRTDSCISKRLLERNGSQLGKPEFELDSPVLLSVLLINSQLTIRQDLRFFFFSQMPCLFRK